MRLGQGEGVCEPNLMQNPRFYKTATAAPNPG
jgi:hypothetical protein